MQLGIGIDDGLRDSAVHESWWRILTHVAAGRGLLAAKHNVLAQGRTFLRGHKRCAGRR